jgi:hypothetical protein
VVKGAIGGGGGRDWVDACSAAARTAFVPGRMESNGLGGLATAADVAIADATANSGECHVASITEMNRIRLVLIN